MTPEEIRKKWVSIDRRETKLAKELKELQELCSHKNVSKLHKANTGNYDPSADSYWIEFHCPDCQKRWYVDQ